jgi:hypothetical protein
MSVQIAFRTEISRILAKKIVKNEIKIFMKGFFKTKLFNCILSKIKTV